MNPKATAPSRAGFLDEPPTPPATPPRVTDRDAIKAGRAIMSYIADQHARIAALEQELRDAQTEASTAWERGRSIGHDEGYTRAIEENRERERRHHDADWDDNDDDEW